MVKSVYLSDDEINAIETRIAGTGAKMHKFIKFAINRALLEGVGKTQKEMDEVINLFRLSQ